MPTFNSIVIHSYSGIEFGALVSIIFKLILNDLEREFQELDEDGKYTYKMMAEANLARAPFLHDEIIELLHRTNSTIMYREIV